MQIIDQQLLQAAKDLMQGKFKLMVEYFIEDTAGYIADIDAGFVDCDYAKIKLAAHSIKSSSRQLGAVALSDVAKGLEQAAIDVKRDVIERNLPLLKKIFAETKESLNPSLR